MKEPTPFKISTYTMGGYICSDLPEDDRIIPLHVFSRLLPVTSDNDSPESIVAKDSKTGCYVTISDYIDNDYTDMPRGRIAEDTRIYKLPSQVFNNQISLRYKYWGFRCISYKMFSNGQLQFTGIMDPKWEPHHIAEQLLNNIKSLRYRIWTDTNLDVAKAYASKHNLDYILVWDSKNNKVTYRRRNLEIYDFNGIMKSGIICKSCDSDSHNDSEWYDHESANKLIDHYFKPISNEKKHLESIMDRLRNIPEFTIDIRRAIFENESDGLGRYARLTSLDSQYIRIPDIEFRRLVQKTVKKILKTFTNYMDRLRKLLNTDNDISNNINTMYQSDIISKHKQSRKTKAGAPIMLEYPTEMTNKAYRATDISADLINSDFNTRYVNILPIISVLLKSYGVYNYYQPNNKYPGIIARFAYNPKYMNHSHNNGDASCNASCDNVDMLLGIGKKYKPGKCYCTPSCIASGKSGRNLTKDNCVFITVNIFRTGSIMITSARNIEQIQYVYKWINTFLQNNASRVFQESDRNYAQENENRNIVKKSTLLYIPTSKIHANNGDNAS